MNILLLAKHVNAGGITSYLLTLGEGMMVRGHNVWIASGGGDMVNTIEEKGMIHVDLPALKTKSIINPAMWLAFPALNNLVHDMAIDMLHAHTRVTQVLASRLSASEGIPYVSTCHGFFKPHWGRTMFPCWGQAVIAISHAVEQHLRDDFGLPRLMIKHVPNGIDVARFPLVQEEERVIQRKEWGLTDEPVIGIIARLSDVKGHRYLIEALPKLKKRFSNIRCVIAGEGDLEKTLKEQVVRLGLEEQVIFSPMVNHSRALLAAFDVFALPSLNEGLGLSVMEAQASGIPVVASAVGGLTDLIHHGETGLAVKPKDVDGLVKALIDILSDRDLATRLSTQGRCLIEEQYSADLMVDRTIDVYHNVILS